MRQRTRYFLVVLLLMFAGNIFAQINSGSNVYRYVKDLKKITAPDNLSASHLYTPKFKKIIVASQSIPRSSCWYCPPQKAMYVFNLFSPIAKDFSSMQMGIVCKKEFEFEKKTSIPLRLRIGSLDYTNYMEQKPNALKPL